MPPELDFRVHPRNRCIHVGFLSLALIPLRAGPEILGLLHLADRTPDRFTAESVRFFEGIGASIGMAIQRRKAEEAVTFKNAEIERFTAIVSHDLRSPLVTIGTFLGHLEEDLGQNKTDRIDADLGFIRTATDKMGRLLEELQKVGRQAGQYVELSLRNAEVVRGMGMFPGLVARWGKLNRDSLRLQFETGKVTALVMGINKFSRQFIQIIMLAAGVTLVLQYNATPGVIIAATFILGRAQMPLDQLISGWKSLVDAHAAYRRLDEGLAKIESGERLRLPDIEGRVEVERVTFGVMPGAPAILKGIQFQIEAGEMLGLIGPSGSGKSTLVRLLTGVWPPVSGAVRIDGADVRHWQPEEIGPQIGYLPQDIELFPGTVAENIARMGEPDSDAVVAAAQLAGAHEMVLRLTNGYDTEIGASGAALSGGQRQRIGLARALYGQPRLVILDEPNAYLDAEGESILVQTFHRLRESKVTLIVVTHKPSLLAEADKLLVLHDGMVRAFGPRDEVMGKLGMAPRLVAGTGRVAEEAGK